MSNFDSISKQLKARKSDQIGSFFTNQPKNDQNSTSSLFLKANDDRGVSRNGGRKGAAYGPMAILQVLRKMAISKNTQDLQLIESDVLKFNQYEKLDFTQLQNLETQNIHTEINQLHYENIFHIGGGHDHIFPLIKALSTSYKNITILNLDAHLDTRNDELFHSGTPFRQASLINDLKMTLHQWGIKELSNATSNYDNIDMKIISLEEFHRKDYDLSELLEKTVFSSIKSDELIILSLDCDVISSDTMEAVSAVNCNGLKNLQILDIFNSVKRYCKQNKKQFITGIYEYNPYYDNLSQKGAKTLAELIYSIISH